MKYLLKCFQYRPVTSASAQISLKEYQDRGIRLTPFENIEHELNVLVHFLSNSVFFQIFTSNLFFFLNL